MKRLASVLAFAGMLAAWPSSAGAVDLVLWDEPLKIDLFEYAAVAYHENNGSISPPGTYAYDPTGSNYTDWLNRFEIDATYGAFSAQLRLDSDLYFNPPVAAPGNMMFENLLAHRFEDRLDVEKVGVSYVSRHLEVTLGDTYVNFGRGLVLSMRKIDELGIDTSLRGLNAVGRVGDFSVNGVAGVGNTLNVDPATAQEANDPDDFIYGAHAEYRFGRWVVPSVNFAQFRYNNLDDPQAFKDVLRTELTDPVKRLTNYSGAIELPYLWGFGSIYVEYAQQDRNFGPVNTKTRGLYGSATGYLGPVTVLVEYKDYRDFQPVYTSLSSNVPALSLSDFYNAPPTLERMTQEVLNNSDITGPRARVDVTITKNVIPFVSMAEFQDRVYDYTIDDPYGGIELHWQDGRSRAVLSGGYRTARFNDTETQKDLVGHVFQDTTHFEYDINQALSGPYSIELDGLHMSHYDYQTTHYNLWFEGQAYLSLKRADHWSVASGYEYYTEAPSTTQANYVNSSLTYDVAPGVLVRLFAGGQRAGIKCVNGVCRDYPAFNGVRMELIAKY